MKNILSSKRAISFLLVILLVLCYMSPVWADTITPSVDKTSLAKGEDVVVTLTLDEAMQDIAAFEYFVYFNDEAFELKESANGTVNSAIQMSAKMSDTKGTFYKATFVDTTSLGATFNAGVVYTFTFTAIKDVTEDLQTQFAWSGFYTNIANYTFPTTNFAEQEAIKVTITAPEVENTDVTLKEGVGETSTMEAIIGEDIVLVLTDYFNDADGDAYYRVKDPANNTYGASKNTTTKIQGMMTSWLTPGEYEITLWANDDADALLNGEATATHTIKVTLKKANSAPTFRAGITANGGTVDAVVGTAYTLDLTTIFTDADNDTLTYTVKVGDEQAATADANYSYTPTETGTVTFVFTANDGKADSPTYTVTLNVEAANNAPALAEGVEATATAEITAGKAYTLDLTTIFTDADNDTLTYTVKVGDEEAATADANYSYTPTETGTVTFVFTANDGKADSPTYTVTLNVEGPKNNIEIVLEKDEFKADDTVTANVYLIGDAEFDTVGYSIKYDADKAVFVSAQAANGLGLGRQVIDKNTGNVARALYVIPEGYELQATDDEARLLIDTLTFKMVADGPIDIQFTTIEDDIEFEDQSTFAFIDGEAIEITATVKYDKLVDDDATAAKEVDALIEAIGKVTPDSGDAITAARDAFDALDDEQKALVTLTDDLETAERAFDLWKKGDVNFDGKVNSQDLSILLGKYGAEVTDENKHCDINSDGYINSSDLSQLLTGYGMRA